MRAGEEDEEPGVGAGCRKVESQDVEAVLTSFPYQGHSTLRWFKGVGGKGVE